MMHNGKWFWKVLPLLALLQIPVGYRIRKIRKVKVGLNLNAWLDHIGVFYFELFLLVYLTDTSESFEIA